MAGKLDVAFGLGRYSIAGGGTIAPGSDRSQNVPIPKPAAAFQNQGAMYSAIGSDDKIYLYL